MKDIGLPYFWRDMPDMKDIDLLYFWRDMPDIEDCSGGCAYRMICLIKDIDLLYFRRNGLTSWTFRPLVPTA